MLPSSQPLQQQAARAELGWMQNRLKAATQPGLGLGRYHPLLTDVGFRMLGSEAEEMLQGRPSLPLPPSLLAALGEPTRL